MIDREALRRLAQALPEGTAVPVPRQWLLELLADVAEPLLAAGLLEVDLTSEEAGAALQRSPVTIRSYCAAGLFKGAYRMRGRQWRIPRSALEAFQTAELRAHDDKRRLELNVEDAAQW